MPQWQYGKELNAWLGPAAGKSTGSDLRKVMRHTLSGYCLTLLKQTSLHHTVMVFFKTLTAKHIFLSLSSQIWRCHTASQKYTFGKATHKTAYITYFVIKKGWERESWSCWRGAERRAPVKCPIHTSFKLWQYSLSITLKWFLFL